MSTLGGHVERARALLHFDKRPSPLPDGVVSHRCATLTRVTAAAGGAGRLAAEKIERTVSYLGEVLGWFPPPAEGTPPFYRILLPGLQADLLCMLPDRRAGALDLARRAWELASAAYPRYVPSHAAKLARCLLLLDRHGEALDFLAGAEEEAVTQENLRALSALRALRVVAHVRGGDGAQSVDSAMTALRDTLHATGSPRIAAETLLDLARALPPARAQPDILALLDEASELFSEMPMPLQEELCRETRGDVLLARGRRDEAAACFAAAAKRSSHYGLLLRVPLLVQKHRHALGEPAAPGTAAVQDRDRILPP